MSTFALHQSSGRPLRRALFLSLAAIAVGGLLSASVRSDTLPDPANPSSENARIWQPRIRSVAVFKNGLGFFLSDAETSLEQGWCLAKEVPPAAFGTLAIFTLDTDQVVDMVGSGTGEVVEFDGRDAPRDTAAKLARLSAAKQLKLELQFTTNDKDTSATGKLVSVSPEYAVLQNESTSFAVPLAGLKRMRTLELPLRVHVQGADGVVPKKANVGMAYLSKGISWIPDYTLKVLDDQTAELTLRGTLVNYAADLVHTDVHLVVGVPHFVHSDFMAPLAIGQALRGIGAAVAAQAIPSAVTTQMMNRAAIITNNPAAAQPQEGDQAQNINQAMAGLPQFDGAAASDYTVYTKKDVTLRRGEKAIVTLFTQKIKFAHHYRWTPPQEMQHSLLLTNASTSSWTTGPCLALSGDQPLSEDLLRYTPAGSRGELPVTTAINIAHEKTEQEVDRKMKAYSPVDKVNFDLVTLEGKLRLHNYEKRPAVLTIDNPVHGKPTVAEQGGRISIDPEKLQLRERQGTIHWQLTLAPGEERTITYRYERYVPSQ